MSLADRKLYRGTTLGWPGNTVLQNLHKTPATTDPLIATLFALECRRHGPAVVFAVRLSQVADLVDHGNVLAALECEVVLNVEPLQFADKIAEWCVGVEDAKETLQDLGFDLPGIVPHRRLLSRYLVEFSRLNSEQMAHFDARMEGHRR